MNVSAHNTTPGIVPAAAALDMAGREAAPGRGLGAGLGKYELDCETAGSREQRYGKMSEQMDRLARLADVGMALAEDLDPGKGSACAVVRSVEDIERICLAFTRIARAIRQINAQEHVVLGLCEEIGEEQGDFLALMDEQEERRTTLLPPSARSSTRCGVCWTAGAIFPNPSATT